MTATLHPLVRETHVSFAQATRRFPSYRGAGRCSPATVWRWVVGGIKLADGTILKLEALRLASRWVTTEEAIDRFLLAQHEACAGESAGQTAPPVRTPSQRAKAAERAGKD